MPLERLDRLIAVGANVSRANAQRLISSGAVLVDGVKPRSGSEKADIDVNIIAVNGREIFVKQNLYLMMNKPLGYVCSTSDPQKTVLELVPKALLRKGLFPAGRLDKYSEGMLIITDDGDFAHRMLSPKKHLPKTYEVEADGCVSDEGLAKAFETGISIGKGQRTSPAELEVTSQTTARVTIYEGMYHQIRRMFDKFGLNVIKLKRIRIGGLWLDETLKAGECRELSKKEVDSIFQIS